MNPDTSILEKTTSPSSTESNGAHHQGNGHHHADPVSSGKIPFKTKKLSGKKLYMGEQVSCTGSRVYVQHYADFMMLHGCEITTEPTQADYHLIDTCGVNHFKEQMSYDIIKKSESVAKEGAQVLVCGCLAGMSPQKIKDKFNGASLFSPKNEKQLAIILGLDEEEAKFLSSSSDIRGRFLGGDDFLYAGTGIQYKLMMKSVALLQNINNNVPLTWMPVLGKLIHCTHAANPQVYAITISQGCLGNCSFCIIPMAKGKTQSMPMGMIGNKIRTLVEQGVKKIVLTSEDTGAYGKDNDTSIVNLLGKIHEMQEDFSLYINFFDPRWLRSYGEELAEIIAKGRIRYLQFPIQSGSNSVLNRMRRAYQMEYVLPYLRQYRKQFPGLAMATQVIVGFPGETEEEFECTRNVMRENLFDFVEVFEFSNRPGSEAEKMDNHLPAELIKSRVNQLKKDWLMAKFFPFYRTKGKSQNGYPAGKIETEKHRNGEAMKPEEVNL